MDTKVKMHDFRDGEVMQLKYFIKKLQGRTRHEAWEKFQDTMSFASETAVQALWAHVDAAVELAAPKPVDRVERKPRKARHSRTPKTSAKRERNHPCPNCETGTLMLKPNGKGRWPICPACHKAGKKGQRVPASLAAPSKKDHDVIVGAEVVKASPRRIITPQDMRFFNVHDAEEMRRGHRPNRDDRSRRIKRAGSLSCR